MNIGIIGGGNVGTAIGKLLAAHGHQVVLSFSKDAAALAGTAAAMGAKSGTPADAAQAEVVVLATPWAATAGALGEAGSLAGRIVWDATNPLAPDMSGLVLGTTTSGGEEVARLAPGARVVKAIPPFAELMHSDNRLLDGRKPGVFVCSDDAEARQVVMGLVKQIGADPTDAGPLRNARYTEPLGMLLVQLAYVQGNGARIGAALLRDHA